MDFISYIGNLKQCLYLGGFSFFFKVSACFAPCKTASTKSGLKFGTLYPFWRCTTLNTTVTNDTALYSSYLICDKYFLAVAPATFLIPIKYPIYIRISSFSIGKFNFTPVAASQLKFLNYHLCIVNPILPCNVTFRCLIGSQGVFTERHISCFYKAVNKSGWDIGREGSFGVASIYGIFGLLDWNGIEEN